MMDNVCIFMWLCILGELAFIAYVGSLLLADEISAIRRRRYEEIADEWLASNRVLKVKDVVFILSYNAGFGILINGFVCADRDDCCYRVLMDKWVLGEMVKKRKKELQKMCYVREESKERFIKSIRASPYFDKEWRSNVDIRLLPEWLTAELVARKLSED